MAGKETSYANERSERCSWWCSPAPGSSSPRFRSTGSQGQQDTSCRREGHCKHQIACQTFLYGRSFLQHSSAVRRLLLGPMERLWVRSLLSGGLYVRRRKQQKTSRQVHEISVCTEKIGAAVAGAQKGTGRRRGLRAAPLGLAVLPTLMAGGSCPFRPAG